MNRKCLFNLREHGFLPVFFKSCILDYPNRRELSKTPPQEERTMKIERGTSKKIHIRGVARTLEE